MIWAKHCGHVLRREAGYVGKSVVMEVKKKEGLDRSRGGWIASRTTCRKDNCRGRKRKIWLNRGVLYETSTLRKCGKGCGSRRVMNGILRRK